MTDKIIINEFLNNFYNTKQLSMVIGVKESKIESVLNDEKTVTSILGPKGMDKIRTHAERIEEYIYSDSRKPLIIESDFDLEVVDMANYIIINKSSIRDTANHFKLGKTTVHDRIEKYLPKISIILYKGVFDVIKSRKSLSITESREKVDMVSKEYNLLMAGKSINEIASELGLSFSRVQRDLADRLSQLDSTLGKEARSKLLVNQIAPLEENQFQKKVSTNVQ